MSDTQTKTTNQAAFVTALGSADQLLLTDANTGQVKRIAPGNAFPSRDKVSITIPEDASGSWIRIAEATDFDAILLSMASTWTNYPPRPLAAIIVLRSIDWGDNKNSQIVALANQGDVRKMRVVYPASGSNLKRVYLEFIPREYGERIWHIAISNNYATVLYKQCEIGSIPEGYTSKEFDLTITN